MVDHDTSMAKTAPPPVSGDYFIPTLNQMGFMSARVSDEYMKGFIEFAPRAPGLALDVGAAYGVATIPALQLGARVIANDPSAEQLDILFESVPEALRAKLTLAPGFFPDDLEIAENSLGTILIARVLHFFDGAQIRHSLQKCFQWLESGGKLFITAETPYLGNLRSFIPEYERRLRANEEWPGFISDFPNWDRRKSANLPERMHLLDDHVLERELKRAGFGILTLKKFARPEFPEELHLDGRESVGAIAIKRP